MAKPQPVDLFFKHSFSQDELLDWLGSIGITVSPRTLQSRPQALPCHHSHRAATYRLYPLVQVRPPVAEFFRSRQLQLQLTLATSRVPSQARGLGVCLVVCVR
jgi:hypothetical protein